MYRRTLLMMFALLLVAFPVLGQGDAPMPEFDGEIVLEGLNGPMGLFVDSEGSLWVIDSGMGGSETMEMNDPVSFEVTTATFGETSQILKLSADGTKEVVAMLPSIAVGTDFLGGARLMVVDGTVYATVGNWQINAGEAIDIPNYTAVISVQDGEITTVADTWAHELANNPDGIDNIESHPFGIAMGPDGLLYVADAAANDLLSINPETGEINTVAVFEGLPGVFPSPFRNNELLRDPVPTAVAFDAEGNAYVSLLTGAPFMPGTAKVLQVSAEGEVSDFATGMTMLIDLQTGPDGHLYAVSFGMFTEEGPVPNSGSIIRILEDGTAEVVIEGLPFATALAFDAEGNGYVTINGIAIPNAGMVLYYEGLTAKEGHPLPVMGS